MRVVSLSNREDTVSQQNSWSSGFYNLSPLLGVSSFNRYTYCTIPTEGPAFSMSVLGIELGLSCCVEGMLLTETPSLPAFQSASSRVCSPLHFRKWL